MDDAPLDALGEDVAEDVAEEAAEHVAAAPEPVSRRAFLGTAAGAAGLAAVAWLSSDALSELARRASVEPTRPGAPRKTFDEGEWRTLEAACDRLLPSGGPGDPGARDVNAIGYLDAVLAESFVTAEVVKIVRDGAATLDRRARRLRAREFCRLPTQAQDDAIRRFEFERGEDGGRPGHAWLRAMLRFVFEAFLGDPVQGGNPDGIAWAWAGHRPGFPRPTEPRWRPTEHGG